MTLDADFGRIARFQREMLGFARTGVANVHRLAQIALEIITLRQQYESVLESDADEEQKEHAHKMLDYLEGVERLVVTLRRSQRASGFRFSMPKIPISP